MTENLVQIVHFPFSRRSVYRELIDKDLRKPCHWCDVRPGKFKYYVWKDDSRKPSRISGTFCSIGCMRVYHGYNGP